MSSFVRNAIVLGLLSAVGPFAIDMYLPAMPAIAADLKTSTSATQLTLTMFFISFGLCQIAYGPLSDRYGRKPPLYAGLALFIAGAIGCALAPDVGWLIAFRVVQGAGAAAMGVIPRAIVRDLHTGVEATRLMALVMLVFSVSPILAPLTGSALIVPFGWRAVFVAVTIAAAIAFALVAVMLPETRPAEARVGGGVRAILRSFGELLGDWRFLGLVYIGGLGMASFFVFLATSSFVYIGHYGLTPTQYSLAFSVNAIGFIGASQFAGLLGGRFGLARVVMAAADRLRQLRRAAAGADARRLRQPQCPDPDVVRVVRVPGPGHPVDDGAVPGGARADRGPGGSARRHLADGQRRRDDRDRRTVLRRHFAADGGDDRSDCGRCVCHRRSDPAGPRAGDVAGRVRGTVQTQVG